MNAMQDSRRAALNIEELALFSVIDLISSVGAMCEWRFYNNRQRVEQEDWYTWNFSPNPDQDGAEFKRLLLAYYEDRDQGKIAKFMRFTCWRTF